MSRITDKELERAKKLAGRKTGVTRTQLADNLKITVARAASVLKRAKLKGKPFGKGKENRALVFSAK